MLGLHCFLSRWSHVVFGFGGVKVFYHGGLRHALRSEWPFIIIIITGVPIYFFLIALPVYLIHVALCMCVCVCVCVCMGF